MGQIWDFRFQYIKAIKCNETHFKKWVYMYCSTTDVASLRYAPFGGNRPHRKIANWMSKNCQKLSFFCQWQFLGKNVNFWQFFKTKCQVLGNFWHSNGNFPENQVVSVPAGLVSGLASLVVEQVFVSGELWQDGTGRLIRWRHRLGVCRLERETLWSRRVTSRAPVPLQQPCQNCHPLGPDWHQKE